ncbi:hypothetical protein OG775_37685 [Streptomyces platensis]|uniref:hypothetical protein n=1 Tax=Streptomyces platensis TaxID=58346 RepID=UPI0022564C7D|nr:hypothetical protein [Streptomyces platensis]MCX4640771.1 hypothetical protein [Streptomyces platensis]
MHIAKKALGVSLTALALTASLPATANAAAASDAARAQKSCHTTGANGMVTIEGFRPGVKRIKVTMSVDDIAADGDEVRVRLLTKLSDGSTKHWPWHANSSGDGTWKQWKTYASDDGGFKGAGLAVARFKGNKFLNGCQNWI